MEEQQEYLLTKEDVQALGILKINPDGDSMDNKIKCIVSGENEMKLRCITPETNSG